MAGSLPKKREQFHQIPGARIAIIASLWHGEIIEAMIERASSELAGLGVAAGDLFVHRLPGSMELPFAARRLFETDPTLDAIIAFGVVLKGATTHDDSVIHQVLSGFAEVSSKFGKPIINEVIGVTNLDDARKRADDSESNKGFEAAFALSELLHWIRQLSKPSAKLGF